MDTSAAISRRILLQGGAAAAVASFLAGCSPGRSATTEAGKLRIGYSNSVIGNSWRGQFVANIEAKGDAMKASNIIADLRVVNSSNDITQQISQLNNFLTADLDVVLIDPVSAGSVQAIIPRLKAAGALVIVSTDPAPTEDALNVVGDNYTWWKMQTTWLVEQLGGQGKIVMVTGVPGSTADVQRIKAAQEVLNTAPGIEVVASVPGFWDPARARTAMANVLATQTQIDGVLMQDVMTEGVIRAFQSSGRPLPRVMTGDYTAGFLRAWSALPDLVSIGVPYSPTYGADSMEFAVRLVSGRTLKDSSISPNPEREDLRNAVLLFPSLAITRDGSRGAWTPEGTEVISLEEALKRVDGKPDSYTLEAPMSPEQIEDYFA
ncbi:MULTISPECIES: ABC transporter substrate-binding protein [unclassified Rhodococcus (in: high G+C Gram-positive bacteria)]|uniref:ABC transporter substrate-binding protein n=1 Tax=unclassified Rhodococcus (in: high G+C Gram-positive bacteria) TaxID=192944 RepID=UPI001179DA94|nr:MULTISPECIES: ABC transporter substrate-binding protein [unclassified Rhodococcus (in: high G+C Gram-positive bacteria)]